MERAGAMIAPMRKRAAIKVVQGLKNMSLRQRAPPGQLGLRTAVWAWFKQVLTDEERAMVFCLVDGQWCQFVKELFQSEQARDGDGVFVFAGRHDNRRGSHGPKRSTSPAPRTPTKRILGATDSFHCVSGDRGAESRAGGRTKPLFLSWDEIAAAWTHSQGTGNSKRADNNALHAAGAGQGAAGADRVINSGHPSAGLPADVVAWRNASRRLQDCARLLDSRRGFDTLTLSKELLRHPAAAEALLTDVTAGRFLTKQPARDSITGMPQSMPLSARRAGWSEYHRFTAPTLPLAGTGTLHWYSAMPAHTIGSMVAHRLELALWHAFWEWQSTLHAGARPPLPRIPEAAAAAAAATQATHSKPKAAALAPSSRPSRRTARALSVTSLTDTSRLSKVAATSVSGASKKTSINTAVVTQEDDDDTREEEEEEEDEEEEEEEEEEDDEEDGCVELDIATAPESYTADSDAVTASGRASNRTAVQPPVSAAIPVVIASEQSKLSVLPLSARVSSRSPLCPLTRWGAEHSWVTDEGVMADARAALSVLRLGSKTFSWQDRERERRRRRRKQHTQRTRSQHPALLGSASSAVHTAVSASAGGSGSVDGHRHRVQSQQHVVELSSARANLVRGVSSAHQHSDSHQVETASAVLALHTVRGASSSPSASVSLGTSEGSAIRRRPDLLPCLARSSSLPIAATSTDGSFLTPQQDTTLAIAVASQSKLVICQNSHLKERSKVEHSNSNDDDDDDAESSVLGFPSRSHAVSLTSLASEPDSEPCSTAATSHGRHSLAASAVHKSSSASISDLRRRGEQVIAVPESGKSPSTASAGVTSSTGRNRSVARRLRRKRVMRGGRARGGRGRGDASTTPDRHNSSRRTSGAAACSSVVTDSPETALDSSAAHHGLSGADAEDDALIGKASSVHGDSHHHHHHHHHHSSAAQRLRMSFASAAHDSTRQSVLSVTSVGSRDDLSRERSPAQPQEKQTDRMNVKGPPTSAPRTPISNPVCGPNPPRSPRSLRATSLTVKRHGSPGSDILVSPAPGSARNDRVLFAASQGDSGSDCGQCSSGEDGGSVGGDEPYTLTTAQTRARSGLPRALGLGVLAPSRDLLRSRRHLARFWDGLSVTERRKIIAGGVASTASELLEHRESISPPTTELPASPQLEAAEADTTTATSSLGARTSSTPPSPQLVPFRQPHTGSGSADGSAGSSSGNGKHLPEAVSLGSVPQSPAITSASGVLSKLARSSSQDGASCISSGLNGHHLHSLAPSMSGKRPDSLNKSSTSLVRHHSVQDARNTRFSDPMPSMALALDLHSPALLDLAEAVSSVTRTGPVASWKASVITHTGSESVHVGSPSAVALVKNAGTNATRTVPQRRFSSENIAARVQSTALPQAVAPQRHEAANDTPTSTDQSVSDEVQNKPSPSHIAPPSPPLSCDRESPKHRLPPTGASGRDASMLPRGQQLADRRLDDTLDLAGVNRGPAYPIIAPDAAADGLEQRPWPYCCDRWGGDTVIASLFQLPFDRIGTAQEALARGVRQRLASSWALGFAGMDLHMSSLTQAARGPSAAARAVTSQRAPETSTVQVHARACSEDDGGDIATVLHTITTAKRTVPVDGGKPAASGNGGGSGTTTTTTTTTTAGGGGGGGRRGSRGGKGRGGGGGKPLVYGEGGHGGSDSDDDDDDKHRTGAGCGPEHEDEDEAMRQRSRRGRRRKKQKAKASRSGIATDTLVGGFFEPVVDETEAASLPAQMNTMTTSASGDPADFQGIGRRITARRSSDSRATAMVGSASVAAPPPPPTSGHHASTTPPRPPPVPQTRARGTTGLPVGTKPKTASCEAGTSVSSIDFVSPGKGSRLTASPTPKDDDTTSTGGARLDLSEPASAALQASTAQFVDAIQQPTGASLQPPAVSRALFSDSSDGGQVTMAPYAGNPVASQAESAVSLGAVAVTSGPAVWTGTPPAPAAPWTTPVLPMGSAHAYASSGAGPGVGAGPMMGHVQQWLPEQPEAGWLEAWLGDEILTHKQWCLEHAQWRRGAELMAVWRVLVLATMHSHTSKRRYRNRRTRPKPNHPNVLVFGSMISGLALPTSDVDVVLDGATSKDFHAIAMGLRQQSWVQTSKEILSATVPVIKVVSVQPAIQHPRHLPPQPQRKSKNGAVQLRGLPQQLARLSRQALEVPAVPGAFSASEASKTALVAAAAALSGKRIVAARAAAAAATKRQSAALAATAAVSAASGASDSALSGSEAPSESESATAGAGSTALPASLISAADRDTKSVTAAGGSGKTEKSRRQMIELEKRSMEAASAFALLDQTARVTQGSWGVQLDLTLMTSQHRGLLTTEFAIKSVEEVPALAPLVLFFKQVLQAGELSDPISGGLPSYAALIIVRAFLASPGVLPAIARHGSVMLGPSAGSLRNRSQQAMHPQPHAAMPMSTGRSGAPLFVAQPLSAPSSAGTATLFATAPPFAPAVSQTPLQVQPLSGVVGAPSQAGLGALPVAATMVPRHATAQRTYSASGLTHLPLQQPINPAWMGPPASAAGSVVAHPIPHPAPLSKPVTPHVSLPSDAITPVQQLESVVVASSGMPIQHVQPVLPTAVGAQTALPPSTAGSDQITTAPQQTQHTLRPPVPAPTRMAADSRTQIPEGFAASAEAAPKSQGRKQHQRRAAANRRKDGEDGTTPSTASETRPPAADQHDLTKTVSDEPSEVRAPALGLVATHDVSMSSRTLPRLGSAPGSSKGGSTRQLQSSTSERTVLRSGIKAGVWTRGPPASISTAGEPAKLTVDLGPHHTEAVTDGGSGSVISGSSASPSGSGLDSGASMSSGSRRRPRRRTRRQRKAAALAAQSASGAGAGLDSKQSIEGFQADAEHITAKHTTKRHARTADDLHATPDGDDDEQDDRERDESNSQSGAPQVHGGGVRLSADGTKSGLDATRGLMRVQMQPLHMSTSHPDLAGSDDDIESSMLGQHQHSDNRPSSASLQQGHGTRSGTTRWPKRQSDKGKSGKVDGSAIDQRSSETITASLRSSPHHSSVDHSQQASADRDDGSSIALPSPSTTSIAIRGASGQTTAVPSARAGTGPLSRAGMPRRVSESDAQDATATADGGGRDADIVGTAAQQHPHLLHLPLRHQQHLGAQQSDHVVAPVSMVTVWPSLSQAGITAGSGASLSTQLPQDLAASSISASPGIASSLMRPAAFIPAGSVPGMMVQSSAESLPPPHFHTTAMAGTVPPRHHASPANGHLHVMPAGGRDQHPQTRSTPGTPFTGGVGMMTLSAGHQLPAGVAAQSGSVTGSSMGGSRGSAMHGSVVPDATRTVGAQTSLPAQAVGAMALGLLRFVADIDPRRQVVALPESLNIHATFNPPARGIIGMGKPGGTGPLVPRDCGLFQLPIVEDPLVVLDPLDPSLASNVARSCFRFHHVRALCKKLYDSLVTMTPEQLRDAVTECETSAEARARAGTTVHSPPPDVTRLLRRMPLLVRHLRIGQAPPGGGGGGSGVPPRAQTGAMTPRA